ncbi:M50 family metallopeptidase [Candidatus Uhrbacteria bacterium]|nr:M50 family metallopeptidase [Candidatus Uhrbacteria bacterium]
MLQVLIFLLVLSVLVLVHEAGHYIAARIFGVKAEEFGYGFPPRALGFVKTEHGWKKVAGRDRTAYKNTVWSLNWLPLGGFVRLKGESGDGVGDADSFLTKTGWQKFIILSAGVAMNWLLAAVIFSVGFSFGVPAEVDGLPASAIVSGAHVEIVEVVAKSAAESAGLKQGDHVVTVNGQVVNTAEATRSALSDQTGKGLELTLEIERDGAMQTLQAKPIFIEALGKPGLGVALANIGVVRFPVHLAVVQGVTITAQYTWLIMNGFVSLVADLFGDRKLAAEVSGPIGIAVLTGRIASQGFWALMQFAALLSLNLAVINFLPIPALDGGRAVFVMVESLRRKRNNPRFEAAIHQAGFVALLILILLVTAQDLNRYGGTIWNGLKGIIGL